MKGQIVNKIKNHYPLLLILSVLLFNSCITARKINYLQESSLNIPTYNDSIGYEEYVLAPTDKLMVYVYSPDSKMNRMFNGTVQMGGMSGGEQSELFTYTINDAGKIRLPVIGEFAVGGLTVRQAKQRIQAEVQSTMIDQCAVEVKITGRYFSVIGGEANGRYPILREKMNLFQALALAGNIGIYGDRHSIKVLRETPTGTQVSEFDIRSKDIINSEFYYIQPNDVIYIQDVHNQFFAVTSFGSVLSTTFSTASFGMLIYNLVQRQKTSTPAEQKPAE